MKTAIRYFSGTGNTAWLADRLKEALEARSVAVTCGAIALDDEPRIPQEPLTLVILYPVYALAAPDIVMRFAASLPAGAGRPVVIVRSPGDPFFDGGVATPLRRALEERDWRVVRETMIVMPPNIFFRSSDELTAQLLKKARQLIGTLADDIVAGKAALKKDTVAGRFFAWLFNAALTRFSFLFGRDLTVSDACNRCGLCVRECPAQTIEMPPRGIKFGNGCLLCLRCVSRCPQHAIRPRVLRFFPVRGYDFDDLRNGLEGHSLFRRLFERLYRRYLDGA